MEALSIKGMNVFFSGLMGEWIGAQNKQIVRKLLHGSHDLFVPFSDSFPRELQKRHLFLKCHGPSVLWWPWQNPITSWPGQSESHGCASNIVYLKLENKNKTKYLVDDLQTLCTYSLCHENGTFGFKARDQRSKSCIKPWCWELHCHYYICTPEPGRLCCVISIIQKGVNVKSAKKRLVKKGRFLLYISHRGFKHTEEVFMLLN